MLIRKCVFFKKQVKQKIFLRRIVMLFSLFTNNLTKFRKIVGFYCLIGGRLAMPFKVKINTESYIIQYVLRWA